MARCYVLLGLLFLIGGCATIQSTQDLPASTAGIESFSLRGRVAVKIESRGYSSSLRWRHAGGKDSLRLISPVGSVMAELESGGRGATLTTADKKIYQSEDVESLTRDILGWDLPLSGLRHWVLGRPDPDVPIQESVRDGRDRLTSLNQSDWRIAYLAYAGDSGLPSRMTLAHESLTLRLIVDRWDHLE
jgi:outer membrane lipoprotein LolB